MCAVILDEYTYMVVFTNYNKYNVSTLKYVECYLK